MNDYDPSWYDLYFTGTDGDVEFYLDEAIDGQGPTLEIGCGTGRILIPLARKVEFPIVGLEINRSLIDVALEKLALEPDLVRKRSKIIEGDVCDFDLCQRFATVMLPYRTFQHLLTPVDQLSALNQIRKHLKKDGRLVFNTFEPNAEIQRSGWNTPLSLDTELFERRNNDTVTVHFSRRCDPKTQLMDQSFIFERWDETGRSQGRFIQNLSLRWSSEWEMRHLLRLAGYSVVALYGDFSGSIYPGFGEQIWIVELE